MSSELNPIKISRYTAAAASLLGAVGSTQAAIIHHPVDPDFSNSGQDQSLISFNLAGDVTAGPGVDTQFTFANSYKTSGETGGPYTRLRLGATAPTARFDLVPLSAGTMIGAGETSQPSETTGILLGYKNAPEITPWSVGQRAYLGLQFESGGTTNYGWADITTVNYNSVTLHSYAYENIPDASIAAGAVPEPSQMALLALGAAGLLGYRARQRSTKQ